PLCVIRPLTSTLFPYTTLFRSRHCATGSHTVRLSSLTPTCLDDIHDLAIKISSRPTSVLFTACTLPVGTRLPLLNASAPTGTPTDRKSTRLNSCHVSISYAVFC